VFGRAGALSPTTCGRTEQPKPATDDWAIVTCAACWQRAPRADRFQVTAGRGLIAAGIPQFVVSVVTPSFDAAMVEGTLPNGVKLRIERTGEDADEAVLREVAALPRYPEGGGGT
jgi:hypothetical protein